MCGRFGCWTPPRDLEQRFGRPVAYEMSPRYNLTPASVVPVVRNDERDVIARAEWGFVAPWETGNRLINARSETITEKRPFKDAFAERRCLVIATGYYEWRARSRGPKQPYLIRRVDEAPFAFAGLWNPPDGSPEPTCTILTTTPSPSIEHIHDRMPVMLEPERETTWLTDSDPDQLQELLQPYPPEELASQPVSTKVNDPTYDAPELIDPAEAGDQSGLDEFG